MDIFAQANRKKLRFNVNGLVSTEQLWDLSVDKLITLEEELQKEIETFGKSTRRKITRTTAQQLTELRLSVVTSILDTLLKEEEENKERLENKQHNQKIMDLIAQKQEASLAALSIEDLQKLIK